MDVLKPFIDDCCLERPSVWVTKNTLWEAYKKWAGLAGEQAYETMGLFNKAIKQRRGVTQQKGTNGVRIWRGIALAAGPDTPQNQDTGRSGASSGANGASGAEMQTIAIDTSSHRDSLKKSATSATSATFTPGRDIVNSAPTDGTAALQTGWLSIDALSDSNKMRLIRVLTGKEPQEQAEAIQQTQVTQEQTTDATSTAQGTVFLSGGLIGTQTPTNQEAQGVSPAPAEAETCINCLAPATSYSVQGLPYCEHHLPALLYKGTLWFNQDSEEAPHIQALRWACFRESQIAAWRDVPAIINAFKDNSPVGGLVWRDAHGHAAPLTAKGFAAELHKAYRQGNQSAVWEMAKTLDAATRFAW
jgi:hypothetical protein